MYVSPRSTPDFTKQQTCCIAIYRDGEAGSKTSNIKLQTLYSAQLIT